MAPLRPLWEFISSVKLALFLFTGIAIMLIAGTFVETRSGTEAALQTVYRSPLMDALIALLALNQIAVIIKRWPYKTHQIGWILTHLAVLVIIAGSVYGRRGQLEGQIFLNVGQTTDAFIMQVVEKGQKQDYMIPLGFTLTLNDFQLRTYPGTTMASDYRSTVVAVDSSRGEMYRHTIRVNDPLILSGFVISQQSYVPGDPPGSVFNVLKNPGTPVIFTGFGMMSLGLVFIVFFKVPLKKRYLQKIQK